MKMITEGDLKLLIDKDKLQEEIKKLADILNKEYQNQELYLFKDGIYKALKLRFRLYLNRQG